MKTIGKVLGAVALAGAVAVAAPASATTLVVTGNDSSSPTYTRPVELMNALSGVGTNVHYATIQFTVGTSGNFSFDADSSFDNMLFLYNGAFNAANPLQNGIDADDDDGQGSNASFDHNLIAGNLYTLVLTGYENDDFGKYKVTVDGRGSITQVTGAVPEPATWAMMLVGFGGVGFAMRRRKNVRTSVTYA